MCRQQVRYGWPFICHSTHIQASSPLSAFLDYLTHGHMIDNLILALTGMLHGRSTEVCVEAIQKSRTHVFSRKFLKNAAQLVYSKPCHQFSYQQTCSMFEEVAHLLTLTSFQRPI